MCGIIIEQPLNETGLQLFLRNGKTIREAPIMESKGFFTEKLLMTAVEFPIKEYMKRLGKCEIMITNFEN